MLVPAMNAKYGAPKEGKYLQLYNYLPHYSLKYMWMLCSLGENEPHLVKMINEETCFQL